MENSNKKIWFRRKRFGLGWYPITWQGWVTLFVYVVLMIFNAMQSSNQHSGSDASFAFAVPLVLFTTALIIVCYHKGEAFKLQWGRDTK